MCPCCGARGRVLDRIPYERIWDSLRTDYGAEFPPEVEHDNSVGSDVPRMHCDQCGLEFFPSESAGDERFYAGLFGREGMPYERNKWEFHEVLRRLRADDALIDFGCGDGAFVEMAVPRVRRAVGVDMNGDGVRRARARGLTAFHADDFSGFSGANRAVFDVLTAFQVLEHLADPTGFMAAARDCIVPSGRIFVSVPNPDRILRHGFQVLDCPPHHVARWRAPQLAHLAHRVGLEVVAVLTEPAFAMEYVRARLREQVGRDLPPMLPALVRCVRLAPIAAREVLRQRRLRPLLAGHALLVELRIRAHGSTG